MFEVPEQYRLKAGAFRTDASDGNNGVFIVPAEGAENVSVKNVADFKAFQVIASDGMGWEHVSVSTISGELPTHNEMEYIKRLFWGDDCWVMELHPPASEYVNNAPVLHLWRPTHQAIPTPPSIMVGL